LTKLPFPLTKSLLLLSIVGIALLSLLPSRDLPAIPIYGIDKVVHFIMYAVLGYLAALTFGSCPVRWHRNRYWILLIIVAYGYWMEFLQGFFPSLHRSFSYADVLADASGAAAGIFFRLRNSFRDCRCAYLLKTKNTRVTGDDFQIPEGRMLISHNPSLPAIIARTFGWRTVNIRRKGVEIRSVCTGKGIISLPHFSYGDVRFPVDTPAVKAVNELASCLNASPFSSMEIRLPDIRPVVNEPSKVVSLLDIREDPHVRFSSNLRRKIRKAAKNGFTVETGGMELLDSFYAVYSRHIRSIGSAALSKRWFRNLLQQYEGGFCGIFLLKKREELAGAAFTLEYQGFFENCWLAVLKPCQHEYGSYSLMNGMINHARLMGATTFSFGRSTRNSGVHRFKQQWATHDLPLLWLKNPPDNINLRKHTILNKIWKTLPFSLRKPLDAYLAKWIY